MTQNATTRFNVLIVGRDGDAHEINWEADQSLMEAIRDGDLPILASCGGACACATCHVHVDRNWVDRLPPRSTDELELLQESGAFDEVLSRLSCQIPYAENLEGIMVTLAPYE